MTADDDAPLGIDRARHEELTGRKQYVWWRRVALALIAVIPVLGLANVFGQRSQTASAVNQNGTLQVTSPNSLRGGLIFTTEIVITPSRPLKDGKLYINQAWFENMTLNGLSPQPSNQSSQGAWQVWDFGPMSPGTAFTVWVSWQTNPTNIGSRAQVVSLYDGSNELMTIDRSVTIFP
jgi:hypothetical protein